MMPTTFASLFSRRPAEDQVLVTPQATLTAGDLMGRAVALRGNHAGAHNPFVAQSGDTEGFLVSLLAFDGVARVLFCLPEFEPVPTAWTAALKSELDRLPAGTMQTHWVLKTSGTTGNPRLVAHTLESLTSTTKLDMQAGAGMRWGLVYDPARFAGLQLVLQALLGGSVLVVPPQESLASQLAFMATHGVNALSATPTLWRKMLMTTGAERLRLKQATLGGEIADQSILDAIHHCFPSTRVVHIYASTEAGVAFSVKDGQAGFPRRYLEPGHLEGIELRVRDDGGLLIKKAAAARLIWDGESQVASVDGFVDSGDTVQVAGERVSFLGRSSGSINVGGRKVMPETIEAVLLRHPSVSAAKVYAKRSSVVGNLVAADVCLRSDTVVQMAAADLRAALQMSCRRHLANWEVPAVIRFVDDIAVTTTGKVCRN
jgi:acyl-coenzyme A synthetase/AMP-(fatty) acid ligase